jgi:hypothetical protein
MKAMIAVLALALVSAAPATQPTIVPLSGMNDEALVIPAASPVQFTGFAKEGTTANFSGGFVLTGTFVYGCLMECTAPLDSNQLEAFVVPDPEFAATLPSWKLRGGVKRIYLWNGDALAGKVVRTEERAALLAGKVADIRRQVAINIEDFAAGIECDSASYTARFIALAKPPEIASAKLDAIQGCG